VIASSIITQPLIIIRNIYIIRPKHIAMFSHLCIISESMRSYGNDRLRKYLAQNERIFSLKANSLQLY